VERSCSVFPLFLCLRCPHYWYQTPPLFFAPPDVAAFFFSSVLFFLRPGTEGERLLHLLDSLTPFPPLPVRSFPLVLFLPPASLRQPKLFFFGRPPYSRFFRVLLRSRSLTALSSPSHIFVSVEFSLALTVTDKVSLSLSVDLFPPVYCKLFKALLIPGIGYFFSDLESDSDHSFFPDRKPRVSPLSSLFSRRPLQSANAPATL